MNPCRPVLLSLALGIALLLSLPLAGRGQNLPHGSAAGTLTERSLAWPTSAEWRRAVLLQDYNTRVVVGGTALLGVAAGVIGCFTLLRKRALMGDALSHAMLPGIGLAFMLMVAAGKSGKNLPVLLAGAALSGLLGLGTILLLRNQTRLKEDAALGIVLSVFFGAGVAILGLVQRLGQGHAAGLESFIYGKAASLVATDALLIAIAAVLVVGICTLLFKEFKLLCFDANYAASLGWPTVWLDIIMMGLVVVVTVIGLQAVGLILIIALLIIPPAAARFWTERLQPMLFIAAIIGALSAAAGAMASALLPNLPSGAMIVLVSVGFFFASLLLGRERGVLVRWRRRRHLAGRVRRQHLLRAAYELLEDAGLPGGSLQALASHPLSCQDLLAMRSWSPRELRREIGRAIQDGLLVPDGDSRIALTEAGLQEAARVARNHRLWELFLITYADIAPSHVDRDADAIEHVLGPDIIGKLEALLADEAQTVVPASPHVIATGTPPQKT